MTFVPLPILNSLQISTPPTFPSEQNASENAILVQHGMLFELMKLRIGHEVAISAEVCRLPLNQQISLLSELFCTQSLLNLRLNQLLCLPGLDSLVSVRSRLPPEGELSLIGTRGPSSF